jgi:murein DD-endopeptidase MepM/ murein hydrolase activator NlpD
MKVLLALLSICMFWLPSSMIAQETNPNVTIHVVQRGETLFRIAQRYSLTVDDLARLNGITNPSNILVGQRLLVPNENSDFPIDAPTQDHMVRAGETLRSIAQFYEVTVQDLVTLNQIANPDTIYVGQVLKIHASESAERAIEATQLPEPTGVPTLTPPQAQTVASSSVIHIVQRGETLFRIATQYGLTVNQLASANSIADPTLIYAGQQLIVPNVEAPQAVALDLPAPLTGLDVMPQTLVEGQTVRFRLMTSKPAAITGTFLGRTLHAGAEQGNTVHTILQGIPVFTEAGIYPLNLTITDEAGQQTPFSMNLQVISGRYGSEYIQLLADRSGLLDPTLETNEQNMIAGVMSNFNPIRAFSGAMGLPAAATIISRFGTRRAYNGGAFDRFHSGTDFAGAPGTPILAAASGRVVLADTLNVRGNATIIDHGWGIFTGYWHQSQIYVQLGAEVSVGDVIGTIGSTGRVTGAHLHWELWVGGTAVDPMQWVRLAFA